MVTTNNKDLADLMNQIRNHGATVSEEQRHNGPKPYILPDFNLLGYNYRMTDLQGAVGIVQLGKLDTFIDERAKWANWYREHLAGIDWIKLPSEPDNGCHGWQSFVTYVDSEKAPIHRNAIMETLQSNGIATRPGTHAVHMLDFYRDKYQIQADDFPGARDCDQNTMAIPLHNRMTEDDYQYVVKHLRGIA